MFKKFELLAQPSCLEELTVNPTPECHDSCAFLTFCLSVKPTHHVTLKSVTPWHHLPDVVVIVLV